MTTSSIRRERAYSPKGHVGYHMNQAARLKAQIDALEAKLSRHRMWLLNHALKVEVDNIRQGDCLALLKTRHNWSYSPETEREMLALRATQKWEQTHGIAADKPTQYISITLTAS
jgi:hypothetical protein